MEQNEIQKEIEWLKGSIKRDYARGKTKNYFELIMFIIMLVMIAFGITVGFDEPEEATPLDILLSIFIIIMWAIITFSPFVARKRIEKTDDAWKMVKIYDQARKLEWCRTGIYVVGIMAYLIFKSSPADMIAINFFIMAKEILKKEMKPKNLIWWLLVVIVAVCLIFLGEVSSGIFFIVATIGVILYRRYIGYDPINDGPDNEIKQLRALLEQVES